MKTTLLLVFTHVILLSNTLKASDVLPNLGLISQLVQVKYTSEAYLANILRDQSKSEEDKLIARKNYNAVRVQLDRIIYQLEADMRMKNSSKKYRQLCKYYAKYELSRLVMNDYEITDYMYSFAMMYLTFKEKIDPNSDGKSIAYYENEAVLSVIEDGWTILNDLKAMRTRRVVGAIEILNNLRLSPPSEIEKKN